MLLKDRRGISPVITTVIIVAVGITIAIAVALWMTGLVGAFMGYEKIEIRSAYPAPADNGWTVTITAANTGSSPAAIDNIFVNNIPIADWNIVSDPECKPDNPIRINVGDQAQIVLNIPQGAQAPGQTLVSGVTVQIKLHSTGGKEYFTSVVLP